MNLKHNAVKFAKTYGFITKIVIGCLVVPIIFVLVWSLPMAVYYVGLNNEFAALTLSEFVALGAQILWSLAFLAAIVMFEDADETGG